MKALIYYRKRKYWPEGLLENIIYGLIASGFEIEISNKLKKRDLIVKMYVDEIDSPAIQIELGWFRRDENFLLYDGAGKRYPPVFDKSYSKFFKQIPIAKRKYWLVLLQCEGDQNLKNCPSYPDWIEDVVTMLSPREVRIRNHPLSKNPPDVGLDRDLAGAVGVISWNSSAVLKAMMHGIPACVYDFPELEGACQIGLTEEWIDEVELGKHRGINHKLLNYLASQQINFKEFSKIDYKRFLPTSVF